MTVGMFQDHQRQCSDDATQAELAIRLCTGLIDEGSGTSVEAARAFSGRGHAYVRAEQSDRAIEDYDVAIRLNPQDSASFLGRGRAYAAKNLFRRAIENYNRAIQLNANSADAFLNRAMAYYVDSPRANAVKDCIEAVRLNRTAMSLFVCGNIYSRSVQGNTGGAILVAEAKTMDADIEAHAATFGFRP